MSVKVVGKSKLSYDDVKYDENGWADPLKYAPLFLDLVSLKVGDKAENGWCLGTHYFSRKLGGRVVPDAWKQCEEKFIGGPKEDAT